MAALLLLAAMSLPGLAGERETLRSALPPETEELMEGADPLALDLPSAAGALWERGTGLVREKLREAMRSAFLMAAVCMLLSLLEGTASGAGVRLPMNAGRLAGATAILLLAMGEQGSLLSQCRQAVEALDRFTKVLTTVFAGVTVIAGRPASAAATAGTVLLFADGMFALTLQVFLPLLQGYLLLTYGGVISENSVFSQAARAGKWLMTHFFRVFLTVYFGYLTLTGLVTGTADTAAVRTAQTLSSTVPLVGSVLSGAAETVLAEAAALRAGVGAFGFLAAVAICLTPLVQAVCHLLVFRLLWFFASSFSEGGIRTMLGAVSEVYGMVTGVLAACCVMEFLTVAVSLTVTGT